MSVIIFKLKRGRNTGMIKVSLRNELLICFSSACWDMLQFFTILKMINKKTNDCPFPV